MTLALLNAGVDVPPELLDYQWRSLGLVGAPDPIDEDGAVTLVDWESAGWRFLQVAAGDAVDRSATAFNDSGWPTGQAAFGFVQAGIGSFPEPNTAWDVLTRLWLRRTVAATAGRKVYVSMRIEQSAVLYWNGVEVAAVNPGGGQVTVEIPGADVLASNKIALQVSDDDVSVAQAGQTYADVRVVLAGAPGVTTSTAYRDGVLADGPLAYYRLGEAAGGVMEDSTSNNRDGTYTGVALTTGGALTASGDSDTAATLAGTATSHADVAFGSWMTPAEIAVEAWVWIDANPSGNVFPVARVGGTNYNYGLFITSAGKPAFGVRASISTSATSPDPIAVGAWHHIVGTWSAAAGIKIYVDGALKATTALAGALATTANALRIGDRGAAPYFAGKVDEVAIYGTALTAAQVAAHYAAATTPPPPPEEPPPAEPVEGWAVSPDRTIALRSWSVTGYGRPDSTSRPTPVQVSVSLSVGLVDQRPVQGELFRLQLSDARAAELGIDEEAVRFTGEITDVVQVHTDGPTGAYQITGVGKLGRASRRPVRPKWPRELDGARAARIIKAAGVEEGTVDPGEMQLLPELDGGTVAQLMDAVTDSAGGTFIEQLTGVVDYHDREHRRGVPVTATLDTSQIHKDVTWEQHVGDVLNELDVTYGDPPARVIVRDAESIDLVDPFAGSLNTILTNKSDAHTVGSLLIARRRTPSWQLPALVVNLRKRTDAELAQLLALKHGQRILVTGLPAAGPYAGDVEFFVEGLAETATKWTWFLAIAVSDPALSGSDRIRWKDVPDGLTWSGVDPTLSWADVALLTNPTDLEA